MEIAFEWYDTKNPILGIKNYIPICELEIRKKDKTWVRFVFKIDSGADTILMKESDYLDLGYSLEGCQQLEFRTANKSIRAHVRMLDMRISGHLIKNIPVAFSTCPINFVRKSKNIRDLRHIFFTLHKHKNTSLLHDISIY